jgi:3-oxoacyl-[acyl-carrier protein] reductase
MSDTAPSCTALVTGASRGIGKAIARALALRGVRIALHYHTQHAAAVATLAGLAADGHVLCAADLADPAAAARLWHEAEAALGPIDVLVNNAAVYLDHPPLATGYEAWQRAWRRTLATNLEGAANLSVLAAQSMAAREGPRSATWGRGRIVNVSSRGAFRGEPDAPAYAASKAGLNALGQSLARALAPRAVYVYGLAPGWVATEMAADHLAGPGGPGILAQHPLGRVTTADEVAGAVVYCALDAPPAMTGSIIDVNGASYLRT